MCGAHRVGGHVAQRAVDALHAGEEFEEGGAAGAGGVDGQLRRRREGQQEGERKKGLGSHGRVCICGQ